MLLQLVLRPEKLRAGGALERLGAAVSRSVSVHVGFQGKPPAANSTGERFFSRMRPVVRDEV